MQDPRAEALFDEEELRDYYSEPIEMVTCVYMRGQRDQAATDGRTALRAMQQACTHNALPALHSLV